MPDADSRYLPSSGALALAVDNFAHQRRILMLSSASIPDINDARSRVVYSETEGFDAVIVVDFLDVGDLKGIVSRARTPLAPVANLSGAAIAFADFSAAGPQPVHLRDAVTRIHAILDRVDTLPAPVRGGRDTDATLLARLYTRDHPLVPVYEPSVRDLIVYPVAGANEDPVRTAERLADSGLLQRGFFDRLHVCPSCQSSRFNVREECNACQSADLFEEAIVHHFRCAHEALEREFRHGDTLVCPKCSRELRHFSVDYSKPGTGICCRQCGHVDSAAAVAFVCLDCGQHHDAETVNTRDVFRYELTTDGERLLLQGDVGLLRERTDRRRDAVKLLVRQGIGMHNRYGRPMSFVRVTFAGVDAARRQHGQRVVDSARSLAVEVVRGQIRETDFVVDTEDGAIVCMPETDKRDGAALRERLLRRLRADIQIDLGVEIDVIDASELPEDLRAEA